MGRIVVMNHITVDGVMQGPARPDEDTREGFRHSGWALQSPEAPGVLAGVMGARMDAGGGLSGWLFGRRTYTDLLAAWNARGGRFKDALNSAPKYVASKTLREPLRWPNSNLLRGDTVEAVHELRAASGGVLGIMGSGELIRSLLAADLIDEYLLMIHPLVLGSGRRLFPHGREASLRLVECTHTDAGTVIVVYERRAD